MSCIRTYEHDMTYWGVTPRESINLKRHMLHAMYLRTQGSKVDDVPSCIAAGTTELYVYVYCCHD